MFDWLFEGRLAAYLFLGVVALTFAALYFRTRKRYWFFAIDAILLLAVGYFVLDRVVETRNEQITRKLGEMAAAVQRRDADAIFRHVAADFRASGRDRATFRGYVEAAFQAGVTGLQVWDFRFADEPGHVMFTAKPEGSGSIPGLNVPYLVRAEFAEEGGEWRLRTFQVFNSVANTTTPLEMPPLR